jgi:hypothetical protein
MPRTIKNEDGSEIEVFDKAEMEEMQAKIKDLEQESNPNWRQVRQEMKEKDAQLKELNKRLADAGIKPAAAPPGLSAEEVERIAEQKAEAIASRRYESSKLAAFGEKKDEVEAVYRKLSAGEKLDEAKIDELMGMAGRMVGMQPTEARPAFAPVATRQGGAPVFLQPQEDKGFGTTDAGKATAAAMGLMIEIPKKN